MSSGMTVEEPQPDGSWIMNKPLGRLTKATISILAEDTIEFDTPFLGRFGLSIQLEMSAEGIEKTILYDANSAAEPILRNLEILGKSLNAVSAIFLSHCHYDHSDGLPGVLEAIEHPVPVIAHPEIFRPCFEINPDGIRHIGIIAYDRSGLEQRGGIFTPAKTPLRIMTGVMTSGEIPRVTSFETLEDLYTIQDGKVVQDHERDDSALILNFEEGLVIVTGCCHAGIVNTMMHAREITGVDKVHAVIGGLHLIDASEEKVEKSIEALSEVDWVFAGHCTGFDAMRRIADGIGDHFHPMHSGSVIHFPIADPSSTVLTIPTAARDLHRYA